MKISRTCTVKDIKEHFRASYPGLKLRFYETQNGTPGKRSKVVYYGDRLFLSQICPKLKEGEISLNPFQSTQHFEKTLQKRFGLCVHILKRSGSVWTKTSNTPSESSLIHHNNESIDAIKCSKLNSCIHFLK